MKGTMEDDPSYHPLRESHSLLLEEVKEAEAEKEEEEEEEEAEAEEVVEEGCSRSDEGSVNVSQSPLDIADSVSGSPSLFSVRVWGDIFFPFLTPSLIHERKARSLSESALEESANLDSACETVDAKVINEACSLSESIAPAPFPGQNEARHDDQLCPRASSWSDPPPMGAARPTFQAPRLHCRRHRLATAVHSNQLRDIDGRKVVIIQGNRSTASSLRRLHFEELDLE